MGGELIGVNPATAEVEVVRGDNGSVLVPPGTRFTLEDLSAEEANQLHVALGAVRLVECIDGETRYLFWPPAAEAQRVWTGTEYTEIVEPSPFNPGLLQGKKAVFSVGKLTTEEALQLYAQEQGVAADEVDREIAVAGVLQWAKAGKKVSVDYDGVMSLVDMGK